MGICYFHTLTWSWHRVAYTLKISEVTTVHIKLKDIIGSGLQCTLMFTPTQKTTKTLLVHYRYMR